MGGAAAPPKEKGLTDHIRKQAAVSSLLLGALAMRKFPNGLDLETLDQVVPAVTKEFNESEEGRVFFAIRKSRSGQKEAERPLSR